MEIIENQEKELNIEQNESIDIKKKSKKEPISYTQELLRKSIHLTSLAIPIIYIFVEKGIAVTILFFMALTAVIIDISTKTIPPLRKLYMEHFGSMLRKHEKKKKKIVLNGASWVLISAVLTVFFFPKVIAIISFTILILCDLMAALIGRKYGKTPLMKKSWEGTSAFFVTGFLITIIYGLVFKAPVSLYIAGFLGTILSGLVEAISKELKIDDNLSIPISAGIVMWIVNFWADKLNVSFINLLK